jgi:intein-encoded DNA endonuclease-like protein
LQLTRGPRKKRATIFSRYLKTLLKQANIETTSLRRDTLAGTNLKDPRTGRIYVRKKDCFNFSVRKQSIPRFAEYVGFTIERKSKRLREAALSAKQQRSEGSF